MQKSDAYMGDWRENTKVKFGELFYKVTQYIHNSKTQDELVVENLKYVDNKDIIFIFLSDRVISKSV